MERIKLQIWDTAGSEQFRSLTPIYYKNAAAVCLVYDSTNLDSFERMSFWFDELRQHSTEQVVICVIASKVDYADAEEVPITKASEYAKSINAQFYQTSAKDGTGVNQLF